MKLTKLLEISGYNDSTDPKTSEDYNAYFVAKTDINIKKPKVVIPKGTVLQSQGGGLFSSLDNKYTGIGYGLDIRTDPNFYKILDPSWHLAVGIVDEIEKFIKTGFDKELVAAGKKLDINAIKQLIKKRLQILAKIKSLI